METWNAAIASLIYQPLDGLMPVRLLRLYPGKPGDDLITELFPTNLEDADSKYEATSYTWGSPLDPQRMNCNDFSVTIQKNAFEMLNALRMPDQVRTIWIDAICIDQSNVEERTSQVCIMHHIYRRAKSVLVWLGKPDQYSSLAMPYAASLDVPKLLEESKTGGTAGTEWDTYTRKAYFFDPEEPDSTQRRELGVSLVKFVNRPWFNRVWVQQEAALCLQTRVICGVEEVAWDNIYALGWILLPRSIGLYPDWIQDDMNRTLDNIFAIQHIQRRRRSLFADVYTPGQYLPFQPLITYLGNSHRFGATDPRDRLFSLQYFADDVSTWFEIDYKVPWQVLYADVAQRFLQQGILGFLTSAGKARQGPDSGILPSWVPDFRDSSRRSSIIANPRWMAGGPKTDTASTYPGKAAGNVCTLPKRHRKKLDLPEELRSFKDSRKALLQSYANIKCMMLDEIVYLADVLDDPFDIEATLRILREDLGYVEKLDQQAYLNNESLTDAYKLTQILSSNREQDLVGSEYVHKNWNDWIKWLEDPDRGRESMPTWQHSMEASEALQGFRFAVTRRGYFCLVPRVTQLHDVAGIFVGYLLGVVLRPWQPSATHQDAGDNGGDTPRRAEEAEYFEFIGDSYIHGMMTNEARCMIEEFNCKHNPTKAQFDATARASDSGRGEGWKTLGLDGGYSRILETLGDRLVKLV
ncbi:heterokaryon incompatibility protein-domain-containing protein [Hypomontagnella submonticulosa]|nr:heterokaryon incompatibility protein-domain-containing protein [Hypomontagnella submonticulosa]